MIRIEERANPAAVGFRWKADSGTEYELVWHRQDDLGWTMGAKPADGPTAGTWVHYGRVQCPEPVSTLKAAREAARRFVDGD